MRPTGVIELARVARLAFDECTALAPIVGAVPLTLAVAYTTSVVNGARSDLDTPKGDGGRASLRGGGCHRTDLGLPRHPQLER